MIISVFYYTIINITVRPGLLISGLFYLTKVKPFGECLSVSFSIRENRKCFLLLLFLILVAFIFDIRIWYNKRGFLYNKIYFWRRNRVCIGQIHELFLSLLSY